MKTEDKFHITHTAARKYITAYKDAIHVVHILPGEIIRPRRFNNGLIAYDKCRT